ncbi:MAG: carboxymuconolactone decarboxylase family protein [Betaproteobacteria bacterium]|jgi:alkylhydroperoxidase family enzyme|nr:carboxymuconolactone decarboxylase family protein [Betaproteobacteria bacterium]
MQRVPFAEFEPVLLARLQALWGTPVNLYRALGNNPKMVAAWTEFAQAIRADSQTPRALRELMILRSGQLQDSEYEWAQHLRMARKAGVREAQIEQLAAWRTSQEFDARERAALELTEAVTAGKVGDAVWAIGKAQFSDNELVELVMTASFYCMVGRVLDALQVEMDPDIGEYSPRLPGR